MWFVDVLSMGDVVRTVRYSCKRNAERGEKRMARRLGPAFDTRLRVEEDSALRVFEETRCLRARANRAVMRDDQG